MGFFSPFKRRRPRWGCAIVSVLAVVVLSCVSSYLVASIPTTDAMPRQPVMESFALEEAHVIGAGFVAAERLSFEHDASAEPDTFEFALGPAECVTVIASTWGHQYGTRLALFDGERVLSEHEDPDGRVLSTQWCGTGQPRTLRAQLEWLGSDLWGRDGQSSAEAELVVYRAPSARVGGLRGLTRGRIPDATLASLQAPRWLAADERRPAGRSLGVSVEVRPFAARLIPEDRATYAVLHTGAQNGASTEVDPRMTPLPPTVPAAWLPGDAHNQWALRTAHRPGENPSETHPAIRDSDEGFMRVLAVVDSARIGVRCADLQLIRLRFGYRPQVRRQRAGQTRTRPVSGHENVATDRLCAGQGVVVYLVPPEDDARYSLRFFEG